jgi:CRISPR-associated endonuclease/helicase Cas3
METVQTNNYAAMFTELAQLPADAAPHPWQLALAEKDSCTNRQIRIPTGFGKTYGVLGAWLWQRVVRQAADWPCRLVWCLPMRVLVEQVQADVQAALARLGGRMAQIGVHALMGGSDPGDWHLHPDREAILIGTQDMLLSRALNRGFGAARARWPMDFGLLNQDCLWVMDEVQLMDVGLATSTQLQSFREQEASARRSVRPCRTWWMSATLQPAWLRIGPDAVQHLGELSPIAIAPVQRVGPLWDEDKVTKPLQVERLDDAKKLAALAAKLHLQRGRGQAGPTLVVVNRVDQALKVYRHLEDEAGKSLSGVDLRLVHSRFRSAERAAWREAFLQRSACGPGTDRIIVATQVIEAGVDMSASLLVTEIAPWPSLVQRFGRSARWGGTAQVVVVDAAPKDDKAAAPYTREAIDASRVALGHLNDVAPKQLESFEDAHPELLSALYPYRPGHLLLRHELDELFDTAADLSGADTDISRFIRSGDERDLQVFWRPLEPSGPRTDQRLQPLRDELCAVPFLSARKWLCPDGKPARQAWTWDWLDGAWARAEPRRLYPGQVVLVDASLGGYDPVAGWASDHKAAVDPVNLGPQDDDAETASALQADASESDESLSISAGWQTIAFHGAQVGARARDLADQLVPELADLFGMAGRWHDAGKAHPAFQGSLKPHGHGSAVAKAPSGAWYSGRQLYRMADGPPRQGFRHELASTLALLALMRRCRSDHPALLGPWRELLQHLPEAAAELPETRSADQPEPPLSALEAEVVALDADRFDLLLYLVCTHHGKVRMSWHASPADQTVQDGALHIRGVRAGDLLPPLTLADAQGTQHTLPAAELVLAAVAAGLNPHTGRGWTERVLGLLQRHGPFTLAWLEALMRAADQQATRDGTLVDPDIPMDNSEHHGLERSHPTVAGTARGGKASPPLGEHPAQGGAELRVRGRAGRSGDTGSRTRPPAHATRYLDTRLGTLSYLELAPHLALAAGRLEQDIEAGVFDRQLLDEHLIATLHRTLCVELTPQLAGWRRKPVLVGTHSPPEPHRVPMLMREYALDLAARLVASSGQDDRLLETLAFAEGRLLSIHPFADFNGRATRLFLQLMLRRLDLPLIELLPPLDRPEPYFEALRAGDQGNWVPLCAVWRARFEQGAQS